MGNLRHDSVLRNLQQNTLDRMSFLFLLISFHVVDRAVLMDSTQQTDLNVSNMADDHPDSDSSSITEVEPKDSLTSTDDQPCSSSQTNGTVISINARFMKPFDDTPSSKRKVQFNTPRRKKVSKLTVESRIQQYTGQPFSNKEGKLYCESCSHVVTYERKSSIDDHIASATHQSSLEHYSGAQQPTINQALSRKELKTEMNEEFCRAFVEAGIELEKFDHESIKKLFRKYVVNGGDINGASAMRGTLRTVAEQERNWLKEAISKFSSYSLIVDESTDRNDRAILNILIIPGHPASKEEKLISFLLDSKEIASTNHQSIVKAVQRTCESYGIMSSKVYGFISDNASYMKKAYSVLSITWDNSIHVTCFSHIFDLVAEKFRLCFSTVNTFMSEMKKIFKNSRARKHFYRDICGSSPPQPVITRWVTWLKAVQIHDQNFDRYVPLFQTLDEHNMAESDSCSQVKDLLMEEDLKVKISLIARVAPFIISAIEKSQSMKIQSTDILDQANDLFKHLDTISKEIDSDESINDGISDCMIKALKEANEKLSEYIHDTRKQAKQPAKSALDELRFFNPRSFNQVSWKYKSIEDFTGLRAISTFLESSSSELSVLLKSEFEKYVDMISSMESPPHSALKFWLQNQSAFPNLSSIIIPYFFVPVSGAEVERSFSQMTCILSDHRSKMKPENVADHLMIAYNYHGKRELENSSETCNPLEVLID